tara:strand:- start:107 stop:532 length:426 start_codon:yes stop_codon:yes gene_type:complete
VNYKPLHKLTSFVPLLIVLSLALTSCSKEDELLNITPQQERVEDACQSYIHTSGIPALTSLGVFWSDIECGDTLQVEEHPSTVTFYMYTLMNPECSEVEYISYKHSGKIYTYADFTNPIVQTDMYSALIPEYMIDEIEFIY